MRSLRALLQPGQFVRLPARPDWGIGQVQSVTAERLTVNFAEAGKVLIRTDQAEIEIVDDPDRA